MEKSFVRFYFFDKLHIVSTKVKNWVSCVMDNNPDGGNVPFNELFIIANMISWKRITSVLSTQTPSVYIIRLKDHEYLRSYQQWVLHMCSVKKKKHWNYDLFCFVLDDLHVFIALEAALMDMCQ